MLINEVTARGDASAAGVPHGADRAFFTRLGVTSARTDVNRH